MQALSMILACKGGKKTIRVKENTVPFLISTLSGTPAKHWTVFGPRLLPYPLCRPAGDIQAHRQPWCLGKKSCGSWRVRPALSKYFCGKKKKKKPLITKRIYPIKTGWITRQDHHPQPSEILAGQWEKLTGSLSENKNVGDIGDNLWKCQGNLVWYQTEPG